MLYIAFGVIISYSALQVGWVPRSDQFHCIAASWLGPEDSSQLVGSRGVTIIHCIAASWLGPEGTIIHRFHCMAASWLGPEK